MLKRIITALVGLAIIIPFFVYSPPVGNLLFFTGVAGMLLWEYYCMVFTDDRPARKIGVLLGSVLYFLWGAEIILGAENSAFAALLVFVFIFMFFWFLFRVEDIKVAASNVAMGIFGILYIDLLFIYAIAIRNIGQTEFGLKCLFLFVAIVWLNDTGGYFMGKFFGRHKLYEKVSPKKTWEGAFGGLLLGVVGAWVINYISGLALAPIHIIGLAMIVGSIGQLGDLCESLLKRSYGIKDSSGIIPGHGGFLDRLDAILFAAPVFYYYVVFFVI